MTLHAHPDSAADSRALELRICSGIHEGASLRLEPGRLRLGSSEDADVILTDPGLQAIHVVLHIDATGRVTLESSQDHPAAPSQDILPGQVHLASAVRWSVDIPQAPWPTATTPVVQAPELRTESTDPVTPSTVVAPSPTTALLEPLPSSLGTNSPPAETSPHPTRGYANPRLSPWISIVLILLLIVGVAWWLWAREAIGSDTHPPASAQDTAEASGVSQVAPAALVEAVREAALAGRVHVSPNNSGQDGWVVTAHFLQDDELESLAERLSRLTPRPALRVLSESDVLLAAQDALTELRPNTSHPLRLRASAPGEFDLEGDVSDPQDAADLIRSLTTRFPEVTRWHNKTRTPQDHAMALLDALKAAGLGQIEGRWSPEGLQLQARLTPQELPHWEQLLTELGHRFGARVPFKATVITSSAPVPKTLPAPFQIQSVVSGDLPYVVLTDGRKLVVGASVAGFRLAEINSDSVRFEGPRALVLQR